jgi:hypothetical protein
MAARTFGIPDAQRIASQFDCQAVAVLTVERDGTVRMTTFGEDVRKCKAIGAWGQGLWSYAVTAVPFQTVFGWGNGGRPKPLTASEMAKLGPKARQYAKET